MRIKKIENIVGLVGRVFGIPIKSNNDTYSANYLNDRLIKTQPIEPSTSDSVWIQRSKNRFNKNNHIIDRGGFLGFNIELEEGKEYTISCDKKIYAVKFARYSTQNDGQQGPQTWSSFYSWTFVASKQTRLFISVKADQTMVKDISELADYNIQIERGKTATEFESYVDDKIYIKNENGDYDEFFKKDKYRYNHLESEDTLIGTWYGKPVYRHITDTVVQSNSTYNETCVYTNSNMDKVINLRGMVAYDKGVHQIGAYANTNFYSLLQYNSSSKKVFFYGANNYVGKTATVIV